MPAEPIPTAPQPLMNLESCLAAGAVFYGHGVRSLRIETVDGRVQRFELPTPMLEEEDGEEEIEIDEPDEKSAEVLKVLATLKPGEWMPGTKLANAVKLRRKGGRFIEIIQRLKLIGAIVARNPGGYRLKS